MSTSRGRPPGLVGGINGSINSNWAWLKLLEYTLLMALNGAVSTYLQRKPRELFYQLSDFSNSL